MNFTKIATFLAVCEYGSFSKAANHSYISQTAISQQIASLEKEIGVELFDRSKYKAELTPAGETFCKGCKELMQKYHEILEQVQMHDDKSNKVLNIGINANSGQYVPISEIFVNFNEAYPDVNIVPMNGSLSDLGSQIERGSADAVFGSAFALSGIGADIIYEQLKKCETGLLVSPKHPFAKLGAVKAGMVADEDIIMISRDFGDSNWNHMLTCCHLDGYEPRIRATTDSLELMYLWVSMNKGVMFMPKFLMNASNPNCYVKLLDTHHSYDFGVAWNKWNDNLNLKNLIKISHRVFDMKYRD